VLPTKPPTRPQRPAAGGVGPDVPRTGLHDSDGWVKSIALESLNQAWDVDDRIEVQKQMYVILCQTHRENFRCATFPGIAKPAVL